MLILKRTAIFLLCFTYKLSRWEITKLLAIVILKLTAYTQVDSVQFSHKSKLFSIL